MFGTGPGTKPSFQVHIWQCCRIAHKVALDANSQVGSTDKVLISIFNLIVLNVVMMSLRSCGYQCGNSILSF